MSLPAEIPDEIANGGVAAVVNYMLKNGFSKEYYKEHHSKYSNIPLGPWREKEYREIDGQCFGVSNTTLRKILNNEKVKESSVRTVVDHLTKALPAGNPTKEKWIACAVGQLGERNVRSHVEVKDDKKTNDLMCMDGTWVYILRRHGGQKF